MGDVISLVERAQQNFDEDEARKLQKKMFHVDNLPTNTISFSREITSTQQSRELLDLLSEVENFTIN